MKILTINDTSTHSLPPPLALSLQVIVRGGIEIVVPTFPAKENSRPVVDRIVDRVVDDQVS